MKKINIIKKLLLTILKPIILNIVIKPRFDRFYVEFYDEKFNQIYENRNIMYQYFENADEVNKYNLKKFILKTNWIKRYWFYNYREITINFI